MCMRRWHNVTRTPTSSDLCVDLHNNPHNDHNRFMQNGRDFHRARSNGRERFDQRPKMISLPS